MLLMTSVSFDSVKAESHLSKEVPLVELDIDVRGTSKLHSKGANSELDIDIEEIKSTANRTGLPSIALYNQSTFYCSQAKSAKATSNQGSCSKLCWKGSRAKASKSECDRTSMFCQRCGQ